MKTSFNTASISKTAVIVPFSRRECVIGTRFTIEKPFKELSPE